MPSTNRASDYFLVPRNTVIDRGGRVTLLPCVSDAACPRKGPSPPNFGRFIGKRTPRLLRRTTGIKRRSLMPTQPLPDNPSLENLRKQAKSFLKALREKSPDALERVREFHPRSNKTLGRFSLSDAQLVIA